MRLYQGVDLVEVARLKEAYERHEAFGEDVFTEAERAYCLKRRNPYPHFAARFAAKEACLKAFGLGLPSRADWAVEAVCARSKWNRRPRASPRSS